MWKTLDQAGQALTRDGWSKDTPYWWYKTVSGRRVWLELEWDEGMNLLMPALIEDE